ncbi:hypothetical protein V9T40_005659 [Parthenolecanium corni]|uniref:Cyclin-like domain-containing protein n=1 Tax=Parthenolecanium corni TaxID=536013 RepID=A0AAN9Y8W9_9HEMI
MPWWYYDKKELKVTPSIKEGMDFETESQSRREGARFIIETGNKMVLGYNTMATGVVYFHRFYMVHSFYSFPKYLTACCALFLAGKVEETPKKAKDIIKLAELTLPPEEFAKFGEDPKEELLILERILLQSIKFDLQVDHPYAFLLKYAKCLRGAAGERQRMQDVLQMAWTFVNDSLCTTLSLQWEPEVIAVAMLYLAAKLKKYEVHTWAGRTANQTRWWEMFVNGVTLELLEDICHQVLDLYSQKRSGGGANSLPSTSTSASTSTSVTSNNNSASSENVSSTSKTAPQHAVVTESTEGLPPLPPNPILPAISNPLPNISTITSVYPPASIVTQPPPLFTAPPPPLPMTHVHDGNMFSIPPPFPGPMNPFNSFGQFGPPPFQ